MNVLTTDVMGLRLLLTATLLSDYTKEHLREQEHPAKAATMREYSPAAQSCLLLQLASCVEECDGG